MDFSAAYSGIILALDTVSGGIYSNIAACNNNIVLGMNSVSKICVYRKFSRTVESYAVAAENAGVRLAVLLIGKVVGTAVSQRIYAVFRKGYKDFI